jgi:hypothetical protein
MGRVSRGFAPDVKANIEYEKSGMWISILKKGIRIGRMFI